MLGNDATIKERKERKKGDRIIYKCCQLPGTRPMLSLEVQGVELETNDSTVVGQYK